MSLVPRVVLNSQGRYDMKTPKPIAQCSTWNEAYEIADVMNRPVLLSVYDGKIGKYGEPVYELVRVHPSGKVDRVGEKFARVQALLDGEVAQVRGDCVDDRQQLSIGDVVNETKRNESKTEHKVVSKGKSV